MCISSPPSVAIGAYACCFAVFALSHQCSHRLPGACVWLLLCCGHRRVAGRSGALSAQGKVERNRTKDTASAAEGRRLLAAAAAVGHRRLAGRSPSVWPLALSAQERCDQRGSAIEPG